MAIFPDARLSSRPDNAAIVECLLSISGEDDQTIDRKHLEPWTGRLPTRFVLISNELPRLRDASGALASRLIILRFTRSFYGQEDTALFDRLKARAAGNPALGDRRLEAAPAPRPVHPAPHRPRAARRHGRSGQPHLRVPADRCVIDPLASVPVGTLYESWRTWCQEHGRDAVGDEPSFGKDLHAAIPGLSKSRHRQNSARVTHYTGIRLRTLLDADPESEPSVDPEGVCTPDVTRADPTR